MEKKVNLGKRLKVGATFFTSTKKMWKHVGSIGVPRYLFQPIKVLRTNDEAYFTKGKRRYYCRVIRLAETRTGTAINCVSQSFDKKREYSQQGIRWFSFTYLVRVLEN